MLLSMDTNVLYNKIASLPDHLKKEVEDFIETLSKKQKIRNKPQFGSAKGMIKMIPDFDEPLEDFKD